VELPAILAAPAEGKLKALPREEFNRRPVKVNVDAARRQPTLKTFHDFPLIKIRARKPQTITFPLT
jgi:hypothetical protein